MNKFKEEAFSNTNNIALEFDKPLIGDLSAISEHLSGLRIPYEKVFIALRSQLGNVKTVNDLDRTSGITNALVGLGLIEQPEVIVIWQYPNHIDKFKLPYLLRHWEDVWYPPSDEAACLYFPLADTLLMITDYGDIHY